MNSKIDNEDKCSHCGEEIARDEDQVFIYTCPSCGRKGCDSCMPAGNGCMCPECEDGVE